jgi:AcrR family transcriptional regulator
MRRKLNSNNHSSQKPRRQLRALQTRNGLMNAARRVFARDGFELARLEDIADVAGKTRGAFYDHFKDKEDVFFAIFEEDVARYLEHAKQELESAKTAEDRIEALTRHLLHILKDRRRTMLFLEFKMYAIRHPRRTKRLAEIQTAICQRGVETTLEELIPEFQRRTTKTRRTQNAMFSAVMEGLTINRLFDPTSVSEQEAADFTRTSLRFILQKRSSN